MAPFASEAQRKYLYANEPAVAAEFQAHTPKGARLPKRVKRRKAKAIPSPHRPLSAVFGGR